MRIGFAMQGDAEHQATAAGVGESGNGLKGGLRNIRTSFLKLDVVPFACLEKLIKFRYLHPGSIPGQYPHIPSGVVGLNISGPGRKCQLRFQDAQQPGRSDPCHAGCGRFPGHVFS
jgi:hypothetical protein